MPSELELSVAPLDAEWDEFVQQSPHGTPYASRAFLQALNDEPIAWYCRRPDGAIVAALLLTRGEALDIARRSDQLIYHGILGAPVTGEQRQARVVLKYFDAAELMVAEMARQFAFVEVHLSPLYVDIRPFLWHNHGTTGARFSVDVRYTTHLDISELAQDEARVLERARRDRRREIRNARDTGIVVRETFDAALCVDLHERTMARQDIRLSESTRREMLAIMTSLHRAGEGRMFVCSDSYGEPLSVLFMGVDRKRAHAMFGGSAPRARTGPGGTAVYWEAFRALAATGVTEVNIEGINSPRRGWFKLSFGGSILPYYALTLDQRGAVHG